MPDLKISNLISFIKELATSKSLTFSLSTATAFGVGGLILIYLGLSIFQTIFVTVFIFSICLSIGWSIEKIILWRKGRKKRKEDLLIQKLGYLGAHQYTFKENNPWPDQDYEGMGWVILVNETARIAYLGEPVCLKCKTDLIRKTNKKCNGIYLECTDCKTRFEVDHVGEKRALADASFQGDVRKNPQKYFVGTYF